MQNDGNSSNMLAESTANMATAGPLPLTAAAYLTYTHIKQPSDTVSTIQLLITGGHSFPRHAKFRAELRNLPVSAEFLFFHGILWNLVLASDQLLIP